MKIHKIKLISSYPVLAELFPHTLGNNHTMEWVQTKRDKWQKKSEEERRAEASIVKCPGIFELYNKGFFIKQPYDIVFKFINGRIDCNMPDLSGISGNQPSVQFHGDKGELKDVPFRDGTLTLIPKISTGYKILSPVDLLFLPVPYPDQYEWETSSGILQTNKSIDVNAQIFLNNYQGEKEKTWKITAGDNLLFIIPLTSDSWVIETELTKQEQLYYSMHEYIKRGIGKLEPGYMKCPMSMKSYANILPKIKQRINEVFEKLW